MPDLKNAAEVGSSMNGCLIWGILGFVVFVGFSVGSPYIVFMGLLSGGAMLGGKALAGNKKDSSKQVSSISSNQSYSFDQPNTPISDLRSQSDRSAFSQSGLASDYMNRDLNQSLPSSIDRSVNTPTSMPTAGLDLADQLEKLAELKKKGYLSDEEFSSMKSNVISQSASTDKTIDSLINHSNPDTQDSTGESRRKSNFSVDDLI